MRWRRAAFPFYPQEPGKCGKKRDDQRKIRGKSGVLAGHADNRNDHFFHADAAVLKGIAVIVDIIVVIIRIAEETVTPGENKGRVDGRYRQAGLFRITKGQHLLSLVIEITAMLLA